MRNVNKSSLAKSIARSHGCSVKEAENAVTMCCNGIMKCLSDADKVVLVGFGTFAKQRRKARVGRNPRTGAKINIAASVVPKFKAGQAFKNCCK